ncbi:MAG: hypothetical protein G01um101444_149 [Parcubacteria group bacterium Gr01-1014_44]|nr:MAG: hypothetical protein G01um101444_149 [Parcubacteria group bacterium Gr01-1014_44]
MKLRYVFLLSLVLSFLIFGNGLFGDFVFDDVTVIENRGDLKDSGNFLNLFVSPYHQNLAKTGLFRPLTMATYAINHYAGGSAVGFHAVNIIIHALNSFLVFWLISFLFIPNEAARARSVPLLRTGFKNKFLSWATFLLFLFHPIHTEAVTSLVGRAELLAFFWSLTTVYFFVKKDLLLSSLSFLLALLSKEVALMVWPIIFYINWALLKNKFSSLVRKIAVLAWPIGLYSLLRYKALGGYFFGDVYTTLVENPLKFASFGERILTAFRVLGLYLEKLIWPVHLSADYSYNTIPLVHSWSDGGALLGIGFFVFLIGLLFFKKTRPTALGFGSLVFLAPYLMISNLVKPVGTIMGERLMYFPSLGLVILLAWLLERLLNSKKKTVYLALALILAFFSARTIIRNKDWRDAKTLFTATVQESPRSLITRTALAAVYIKADEWGEAKEQLDIAQGIYKDNSHLQNILGIMADHEGDYALAESRYQKSLELNPDAIIPHINLAELYLKTSRMAEAGASFKKVIDFYPVTEYVIRYAYIQIALKNPDEAIGLINYYFEDILRQEPDLSALVGTAYFVKGDYKQAAVFLRRALELGNTAPEVKQMLELAEKN